MGDVVAQDIKNIKKDLSFDDAYEIMKWRGLLMAAMALNGSTSWGKKIRI